MLQAFVITLREGLEAFLIVAISLAYLRKTGRGRLVPAVHWGIATSLVVSIAAFRDIALGAQAQIAILFASDGEAIIHPEPARFFEVPIQGPLPEELNYIR